ncbi:MAG: hypothetical protein Q9162_000078 [Coniocarpon cinnabarinum]
MSEPTTLDPSTLPAPHPTRVQSAVFYLSSRIIVPASAALTFRVLADPRKYSDWNTFIPQAEVNAVQRSTGEVGEKQDGGEGTSSGGEDVKELTYLREGDEVVLHARLDPKSSLKKSPLRVKRVTQLPLPSLGTGSTSNKPNDDDTGNLASTTVTATGQGVDTSDIEPLPEGRTTYRLEWGSDGRMLSAHRVMEVRELEDDPDNGQQCEFRTWEVMNGPLAYLVKKLYSKVLTERFHDWARDLRGQAVKVRVEPRVAASEQSGEQRGQGSNEEQREESTNSDGQAGA